MSNTMVGDKSKIDDVDTNTKYKKTKKVHFTHFHKKIKSCHENFKKTLTCTFLFLKSLRDDEKIVCICYQGLSKVWRDLRKSYLRKLKKVHVAHFYKKIKSCNENYKKP